MKGRLIVLFSTTSLLLAACHSSRQSVGSTADIIAGSKTLYQFKWNVTEVQGQAVAANSDPSPYLIFTQGRPSKVTGSTGCNNLNGSFVLSGSNNIRFSPLATTRMACMGANKEGPFLDAIGQADSWLIFNNELTLKSGKTIVAKFSGIALSAKSLR